MACIKLCQGETMVRFGVAAMFSLTGAEVRLIEEGELMTASRLEFQSCLVLGYVISSDLCN